MNPDSLTLMKQVFENKRANNPRYSLNALSRDLKISQSQLVKIFQEKQKVSVLNAYKLANYLKLNDSETLQLLKMALDEELKTK